MVNVSRMIVANAVLAVLVAGSSTAQAAAPIITRGSVAAGSVPIENSGPVAGGASVASDEMPVAHEITSAMSDASFTEADTSPTVDRPADDAPQGEAKELASGLPGVIPGLKGEFASYRLDEPAEGGTEDGTADIASGGGTGDEMPPWESYPATEREPVAGEPVEYFDAGEMFPEAGDRALSIGVPYLMPGFQFHGGLLYLQPSSDNLGWGILTTEENYASPVPIATPLWNVETLQPGYEPGLEIGGGYTFAGTGRDVQANWQHLRTNTNDAAAVTQSTGMWISPFSQTGPPTAETYQELNENEGVNKLLSATAQVKFAYDAVNLDFGQFVSVGQSLMFRLFAGVGYARLQQRLYSTFYGAEPSPSAPFPENVRLVIALNNTSTFWGVGPRFGFDSSYTTRHGLRLTGQLAGALLIGQTQPAQYEFSAQSPDLAAIGITQNDEYVGSEAFSHVVWATNAKLGVGYTKVLAGGRTLSVDAGYLAAIYVSPFSGYETNENILALQIGSLSSGSIRHIPLGDFTLNGFYLNAGVTW